MLKLFKKKNDKEKELERTEKNVEKYPDNLTALLARGRVKAKLGRYEDAIKDYNAVIERDVKGFDALEAFEARGEANLKLNRNEEALQDLNQYFCPNFKTSNQAALSHLYYRGLAKEKLGHPLDAKKDYDMAIESSSHVVGAYFRENLTSHTSQMKDYLAIKIYECQQQVKSTSFVPFDERLPPPSYPNWSKFNSEIRRYPNPKL